jgi:hypothetical protein
MSDEATYILHCLCACLIGRGVLSADDFREDIERYARAWSDNRGSESPVLADFLKFLKKMAAEKRDVDARIAASLGTALESTGRKQ